MGDFSTNPGAYLARFGGITHDPKAYPWTRWALVHGALVDDLSESPSMADFDPRFPESLELARKLGIRISPDGRRDRLR